MQAILLTFCSHDNLISFRVHDIRQEACRVEALVLHVELDVRKSDGRWRHNVHRAAALEVEDALIGEYDEQWGGGVGDDRCIRAWAEENAPQTDDDRVGEAWEEACRTLGLEDLPAVLGWHHLHKHAQLEVHEVMREHHQHESAQVCGLEYKRYFGVIIECDYDSRGLQGVCGHC